MATLVAPEDFSPGEDAVALNKACEGTSFYSKVVMHCNSYFNNHFLARLI